jgi:hypothetical protein
MFQVRQGDVLIERVTELPQNIQKQKRGKRIVLAEGEVTGHAHAIYDKTTESYVNAEGELFLSANTATEIRHEEHGTIKLPVGTYRVIRQREYSPGEIRQVLD